MPSAIGTEPPRRERAIAGAAHAAIDAALEVHVERVRAGDDERGAEERQRDVERRRMAAPPHAAGGGDQDHERDARLRERPQIEDCDLRGRGGGFGARHHAGTPRFAL